MTAAAAALAAGLVLAPGRALHAQGPPTDAGDVESVIAALGDEDYRVRRQAARRAATLGPAAAPAVPALAAAYRSDDQTTRTWVVRALNAIGPAAAGGVPVLVEALGSDEVRTIRQEASEALGAVGVATPEAVAALAQAATNEVNGSNRAAALATLGTFGPDAAVAFPVMHAALQDRIYYVRQAAAGALGELGPAALDALPALEEIAARDPVVRVRRIAAASVERLRAAEAVADAEPAPTATPPEPSDSLNRPVTDADHPVPENPEAPPVRPDGLETPEVLRPDPANDDSHAMTCGQPTDMGRVSVGGMVAIHGTFASINGTRCFLIRFPQLHPSQVANWLLSIEIRQDVRETYVMDVIEATGSYQPLLECTTQEPSTRLTAWGWDDRDAVDQGDLQHQHVRNCSYPETVRVLIRRTDPNHVADYTLVGRADNPPGT